MSTARDPETGEFVGAPHAAYECRADGYCRWRVYEHARASESYVYVHQLLACLDDDPREVFGPRTHVHHIDGVRWHNIRENVEVRADDEHANYHMNGRSFDD